MTAVLVLAGVGIIAMVSDAMGFGRWMRWVVGFGLIVAFAATFCPWQFATHMWEFDHVSLIWTRMLIGFSAVLYSLDTHEEGHYQRDALLIFSLIGAVLMTAFSHILMLFLAIEIMSIPLYVLAGTGDTHHSLEASLKYFILGSFATAILLFGIALGFAAIPAGALLVVIGLCFKVGVVPFHLWVPDVYQGSPIRFTAFMSIVVKLAAIAGLSRFLALGFEYGPLLIGIATISMIIGAFLALHQSSFKRWMAYSGIAHAGFMVVLVAIGESVLPSLLLYAFIYGLGSLVVFGLFGLQKDFNDDIESLKGLFFRQKGSAIALILGMLSLAGIPPLPGFFAKFLVLAHSWNLGLSGVVTIALIASLVSTFVYLKFIAVLFTQPKA
jgi:NADH-quinone oxidoreductase subunit N